MMGSKHYLNILFLWVRNIGRALRIVDLGSDLRLDLLVPKFRSGLHHRLLDLIAIIPHLGNNNFLLRLFLCYVFGLG